jgi:hypothetical protein
MDIQILFLNDKNSVKKLMHKQILIVKKCQDFVFIFLIL